MTYLLITAALLLIIGVIAARKPETNSHDYSAHFGNAGDHLGRWNHGWAVTGSHSVTKKVAHENCIVLGPTGSGKTQTVILNTIFSLARGNSSIVINDTNGEICENTSGWLQKESYKILIVDFSNSLVSENFNPILKCRTVSDIQRLALVIVLNTMGESKGDQF